MLISNIRVFNNNYDSSGSTAVLSWKKKINKPVYQPYGLTEVVIVLVEERKKGDCDR